MPRRIILWLFLCLVVLGAPSCKADVGESCAAREDCAEGLLCVFGTCYVYHPSRPSCLGACWRSKMKPPLIASVMGDEPYVPPPLHRRLGALMSCLFRTCKEPSTP